MRKTTKIILLLFSSFFLCLLIGNAQGFQRDSLNVKLGVTKKIEYLHVVNVDGSTGDSILVEELYLDSLGRTTKKIVRDTSKYVKTYTYIYNKKSQLSRIKGISTKPDEHLVEKKMKYNSNGLVRLEKSFINGKTSELIRCAYDAKDQRREVVIKSYTRHGYYNRINYLFNNKGKILKQLATATPNPSATPYEILEYEYDEKENLIYIHRLEKDGVPFFFIEYEYDNENRIIKEKHHCRKRNRVPEVYSNIISQTGDILVIKYKYDANGLLVEKKQWLNNIFIGLKRYEYVLTKS